MKRLILVTILLFISSISFTQTGWFSQPVPFATVNDIQFINSQTGFIVGTGSAHFAKTTDGGTSWTVRAIPIDIAMNSVSFINENTGWIGGYKDSVGTPGKKTLIYSTTNSGLNWILKIQTFTQEYLTDIYLVNKDSLIYTEEGFGKFSNLGYTFTSFDGGSTYSNILTTASYSIHFLNKNTGWVVRYYEDDLGPENAYISKTTNTGKNWNNIYNDARVGNTYYPKQVFDISFPNVTTGFLCGEKGRFAITTNGGTNWIDRNLNATFKMNTLYFFDENTGFVGATSFNAADSGALKRTTNGGVSWTNMTNNILPTINKIIFVDYFIGWGISSNAGGYIMKTLSGGITSINSQIGNIPDLYSLSQNFPNPFNPSTLIQYSLPQSGMISITLFDVTGKHIKEIVNEYKSPGSYSITFNGSDLPSGVYYYTLISNNYKETKSMVLVK